MVYKFILTLSCTQMRCEITSSKLKCILNCLKYDFSQSKFETFILVLIEKNLFQNINNEVLVDLISNKSQDIMKLLNL